MLICVVSRHDYDRITHPANPVKFCFTLSMTRLNAENHTILMIFMYYYDSNTGGNKTTIKN